MTSTFITEADKSKRLNDEARKEGWGQIIDKVFGGRLKPEDTETVAREVARWAWDYVFQSSKKLDGVTKRLEAAEREVEIGKQVRTSINTQLRLESYMQQAARHDVERELADSRCQLTALQVWFARAQAQGLDVPESLTERKLNEWRNVK